MIIPWRRAALGFVFWFFILVPDALATSVIAVRTPYELIIGADSYHSQTDIRYPSKTDIGQICKIIQAGDTFVIPAGVSGIRGQGINFDVFQVATDIFSRKLPIQERIDIYDAIAKWNLIQYIDLIRNNKTLFARYSKKNNLALSLIVAMKGDDFPIVYRIEHLVINSAKEPAMIKESISKFTYGLTQAEAIWSVEDEPVCKPIIISTAHNENPRFDVAITKCIELISKERQTVKLPVDIIRITNRSAEWIQHKPECQDIK